MLITLQSYVRRYIAINKIKHSLIEKIKSSSHSTSLFNIKTEIIKDDFFNESIYTKEISSFINELIAKENFQLTNYTSSVFSLPCMKYSYKNLNNIEVYEYYKGQYDIKGNKSGFGISVMSNKSIYYGTFINNLKHGKGILLTLSSLGDTFNYYIGSFINDNITGKGTLYIEGSSLYKGYFVNNIKTGKGKETFSDGSSYEGEYVSNEKEGNGIYRFSNNKAIYEGEFHNGKFNGKGKIKWKDGRSYEGSFVNGIMEGKGKFKWQTGDIYEGDYLKGNKNGNGIFKWNDGRLLKGAWKNNKLQGNCVITGNNGEESNALFRFGKLIYINNIKKGESDSLSPQETKDLNNIIVSI